ncbi:MerR family transcriptional regulator [Streptomyces sp. NPDC059071]|uniref:MerR family transcriptional regulator n=1 Tax=unclassified Streptomyces TaxID=2593676 RepID=UPI003629161C
MRSEWTIGGLAAEVGVSVKTVRYYTERGLLPGVTRSAGGHRRYDRSALERLRLLRALRAMGMPLTVATDAATGELPLGQALDSQIRGLETELQRMRWRRAALLAVRDGGDDVLALHLLAAVPEPPDGQEILAFWRRVLPPRLPAPVARGVAEAAAPALPRDPAPRQVLLYARLHALVTDRGFAAEVRARERRAARAAGVTVDCPDPLALYEGLGEAYALAATEMTEPARPTGGPALDTFVRAYARSRGEADTPAFRQALHRWLGHASDPRMGDYWTWTAELNAAAGPRPHSGTHDAPAPTLGASHAWLLDSLRRAAGGG